MYIIYRPDDLKIVTFCRTFLEFLALPHFMLQHQNCLEFATNLMKLWQPTLVSSDRNQTKAF
jgi:hypothetical protein